MLRVSAVHHGMTCVASSIATNASLRICKVFFSSYNKEKVTAIKQSGHYEIVRREVYPAVDQIDSKKMSKAVRKIFEDAKELANRDVIAIEGPPSDRLESLLAMRIKNNKT